MDQQVKFAVLCTAMCVVAMALCQQTAAVLLLTVGI